jgi:hypothetical protein
MGAEGVGGRTQDLNMAGKRLTSHSKSWEQNYHIFQGALPFAPEISQTILVA